LVPPRPETTQLLTQQQEQDLEQMKMFVQLRQDLERVSDFKSILNNVFAG
jgi:hypothetical protein